MHTSVYLPLLLSALLAAVSPYLVRRLPPPTAARTLVASATVLAAATTVALALLACTLASYLPFVGGQGRWSGEALERHDPVPTTVSVIAVAALLLGVSAARDALVRRARTTRRARAVCGRCLPGGTELLVLPEPRPRAFAVPGTPGAIVVTTGMLQTLDPAGRRALLAHERAHLRHGHHRWQQAADIAAALDPLLVFVRDDVAFALERWADEEAASAVGDRDTVARALARAALASTQAPSPAVGLGFERRHVLRRISALQAPAPPARPGLLCLPVAGAVCAAVAVADATVQLAHLALIALGRT